MALGMCNAGPFLFEFRLFDLTLRLFSAVDSLNKNVIAVDVL
jgi:hypothetical protein